METALPKSAGSARPSASTGTTTRLAPASAARSAGIRVAGCSTVEITIVVSLRAADERIALLPSVPPEVSTTFSGSMPVSRVAVASRARSSTRRAAGPHRCALDGFPHVSRIAVDTAETTESKGLTVALASR